MLVEYLSFYDWSDFGGYLNQFTLIGTIYRDNFYDWSDFGGYFSGE